MATDSRQPRPLGGETVCFEQAADPAVPVSPDATGCFTAEGTTPPADSNGTCFFAPPDAENAPDAEAKTLGVDPIRAVPGSEAKTLGVELGNGPSAETLLGVSVPGYDIIKELGRGGMGVVYKARDRKLNRVVALKMVLAGAHAGSAGLARFRAEAAAVAQLQHPNIVQIYETGECDGRPYFALEYVSGGSLEDRLLKSPLSPKAAARLMATLALTMDAAHQRGIVHRDLKPGNVLLAEPGNGSSMTLSAATMRVSSVTPMPSDGADVLVPKVADFGLAKRLDESSSQTQSGSILGTPCYMAPEQARGLNDQIGPPADIYALGVILYELLVGRPPFRANSPLDTIRQVVTQEPIPPRHLEPRVPLDLETICLKCLHKEPNRRYETARHLADDLERFLNNEPVLARPISGWERAWKWARKRPAIVALMGVCLAALVGFIGIIVWFNLSLAGERDQARREALEARDAAELTRKTAEGRKLFEQANQAAAAKDWSAARLHLSKLLTITGDEPALAELSAPGRELLAKAEGELTATERAEAFARLTDEARFLGTLYTGMDLEANLRLTRDAAEKALAVYALTPEAGSVPELPGLRDECFLLVLILAETRAQAGDHQAAVALLDAARRFGPPSRAWHFRRARYLRKLGNEDAARKEDDAAAATAPANGFDHFVLADELYRRDDFDGATREFDAVLREEPGHFWAQYLSSLCLLRQHRPAEARARLDACLAKRTDYVWLYLLRGFAHADLGAFDAADDDYKTALGMPLDEFSRYVLFVNRGVLRVRQKRTDDALADLREAVKLRPNEYQARVNLAQAHRQAGRLDAAGDELDAAVKLSPDIAHLYRLRARLWLERKQPENALADFDEALRRQPDGPARADDAVERGRTLLALDRAADAVTAFDDALVARPKMSAALRLKADALFRLARYQEAIAAFDEYVLVGPALESVYRGRGLARVELGQYPGAIEDFTKAVELKPSAEMFVQRGFAHVAVEAFKLAQRDFTLAIELEPANPSGWLGRASLAAKQRRMPEALKDAEQAVRVGGKTARVLFGAARIHALAGGEASEARAVELVRDALAVTPAAERVAFVKRYIEGDAAFGGLLRQPRFADMLRRTGGAR